MIGKPYMIFKAICQSSVIIIVREREGKGNYVLLGMGHDENNNFVNVTPYVW
jgi:hypothetical protein